MVNVVKNDKNLNKKSESINPEISGEIKETSENISNIVYISEIQKEIWELQRLKRSLKENKENFKIFDEKVDNLLTYLYDNYEKFSKKERQQFRYLCSFRNSFRRVLEKIEKTKTLIEKNENTKREILIIGQLHISGNGKSNSYVFSSQSDIDVFLEYFLDDNLVIGDEKYGINSKNNSRYEGILMELIYFFIKKGYLEQFFNININKPSHILSLGDESYENRKNFLNYPLPVSSENDKEKIEKFFNSQEMITFYGKQFFKKDNEAYFKNLCVLKYFIKKLGIAEDNYLTENNYNDYKFSNLGKNKFIYIEEDEGIQFNISKFNDFSGVDFNKDIVDDLEEIIQEKGMEEFLQHDLENTFFKYFKQINTLLSEYDELLDLDYEIKFGSIQNNEEDKEEDNNASEEQRLDSNRLLNLEPNNFSGVKLNKDILDKDILDILDNFKEKFNKKENGFNKKENGFNIEKNFEIGRNLKRNNNSILKIPNKKIKSKKDIYKEEKFEYFFGEIMRNLKRNKNNFRLKIATLLDDLENAKEKLERNFGNIGFIDFFEYLRFKILSYLTFTYRETMAIENIEKLFPKDQKQIPIMFGCGHNGNWEEIVKKYNEKNPENHYSLKIIDFGK